MGSDVKTIDLKLSTIEESNDFLKFTVLFLIIWKTYNETERKTDIH